MLKSIPKIKVNRNLISRNSIKTLTKKKSPSLNDHISNEYDLHNINNLKILNIAKKIISNENLNLKNKSEIGFEVNKKLKILQPLQLAIENYDQTFSLFEELKKILEEETDEEMKEIARKEIDIIINTRIPNTIENLKKKLILIYTNKKINKNEDTNMTTLIEIKPGIGGVEASHFATTLMNIYSKLSTRKRWNLRPINVEYMTSGQGQDGLREAILEVSGENSYHSLRWEAGVHRVQRVPVMQNTSTVHTSTATVIVLPLNPSNNQEEEKEELFDEKDIKLETMRSQGAGGQHVNKTESAVRLTHIPTGTVVSMQDSRSQHQNREKAFMILRARLNDLKLKKKQIENRDIRLSQVKNSNRSEKIRTYNFQQGRVTDHRIGLTLPRLNDIIEGGDTIDIIWDGLIKAEESDLIQKILDSKF